MLTEGALEAVRQVLPAHCFCCGSRDFTIAPEFFSLVTHPRTRNETVLYAPTVAARCNHCALLLLFSPEPLGIVVTDPTRG